MSLIFHCSNGETFEYDGENFYHFGIKGMKWGVRRFQNEDGSLTPAGKARYGTKANFEKSRSRNRKIAKSVLGGAAVAGAAALAASKTPAVKKGLNALKVRKKLRKGEDNLLNTFDNINAFRKSKSGAARTAGALSSGSSSRKLLNAASSNSSSAKRASSKKMTEQERRIIAELMRRNAGVNRDYAKILEFFT